MEIEKGRREKEERSLRGGRRERRGREGRELGNTADGALLPGKA